jgi:hypothetical protein
VSPNETIISMLVTALRGDVRVTSIRVDVETYSRLQKSLGSRVMYQPDMGDDGPRTPGIVINGPDGACRILPDFGGSAINDELCALIDHLSGEKGYALKHLESMLALRVKGD